MAAPWSQESREAGVVDGATSVKDAEAAVRPEPRTMATWAPVAPDAGEPLPQPPARGHEGWQIVSCGGVYSGARGGIRADSVVGGQSSARVVRRD